MALPPPDSALGGVNSPALDSSLRQHVPALTDIGQAVALVRALERDNEERVRKNARILEAYNAAPPYDRDRLRAEGLAWKTNFSTKPLALVVDRVVPQYVSAIRNLRYLTASALPDDLPEAARKTELFRKLITDTVRGHPEWEDLLTSVVMEMVLFGFAAVGWPWLTEWFPTFYSQDDFLVPVGTRHVAGSAPVLAFREYYLRHELLEHVADREAARAAGWDVENVIEAINAASNRDPKQTTGEPTRVWMELERELSVASSFVGADRIRVWHVFVAEVDGRVTHVAFDDATGKQLLWRDKVFGSMAEVAAFFSFQHGTGKLHSSKGVGRELYNVARVLDRARCEVVDRLNLSGKFVFQCSDNDLRRFRMSVYGNAILVTNAFQYVPARLDSGVESYFAMDRFLTQLLEHVAGVPSFPQFERERVSGAEAQLFATYELQRQQPRMERFLVQFARMMTVIQQRLLSPLTKDPVAQQLQGKLRELLTPEEYDYLAQQPTITAVKDLTEAQRVAAIQLAAEARGNPLYNQYELERRRLLAQFDEDFARAVLLPPGDPTTVGEHGRLQQLELILLERGVGVPVSPRDEHLVHLGALHDYFGGILQALAQQGDDAALRQLPVPTIAAILRHAADHINALEAAGRTGEAQPFRNYFQKVEAVLRKELARAVEGPDESTAGEPLPAEGSPVSTEGV